MNGFSAKPSPLLQTIELVDEVAQGFQLGLGHGKRFDHIAIEDQLVVDKVDGRDIGHIDEIATTNTGKGRGLFGRLVAQMDGIGKDRQRGEMGAHLAVGQIKVGVVAVCLQIDHLVEIDNLYAISLCDEELHA